MVRRMHQAQKSTDRESDRSEKEGSPFFATTLWSVVLEAQQSNSPEASVALETLCRTYWYPLYALIRRRGYAPHEAEDLTQEFFAHLLQKGGLKSVTPEKGKFRTYLLVGLGNFLTNQ